MNKSEIKFYEATIAGAVTVASHALYGRRQVLDGYNGLLATTADEWVEQLSKLILDEKLRRRLHAAAENSVRMDHNIDWNCDHWMYAWQDIRDRRVTTGRELTGVSSND